MYMYTIVTNVYRFERVYKYFSLLISSVTPISFYHAVADSLWPS